MGVAPLGGAPSEPSPLDRQLESGLAVFRWVTWAWLVIVLAATRSSLLRPWPAVALAAAALAVTALTTVLARGAPGVLRSRPTVALETGVAVALPGATGFVYGATSPQTLGSIWPLGAVLAAGFSFGPVGGTLSGAAVAAARVLGAARTESLPARFSAAVLFVLAGAMAGLVARRLRTAERRISAARAREEVARTLHDGVLQTLAIVQRRADDGDLARLAREQERELRSFLFGAEGPSTGESLGARLRSAAARHEQRYGGRVQVVLAEDVPALDEAAVAALSAAVGEALANAAKHGGAGRVTVYAEPADGAGVFCSVKDDGTGFEPDTTAEGVGITSSIRARIAEVGGRTEIDGNPGTGTEVRLWVPRGRGRRRRRIE